MAGYEMTAATPGPEAPSRGFNAWLGKLYRLPEQGMCGGVIAGLSDYYGWNVRLARVLVVLATLMALNSLALIAYGVLWYLLEPRRSADGQRMDTEGCGPVHFGRRHRHRRDANAPTQPVSDRLLRQRLVDIDRRLRDIEACITDADFHLQREFRKLAEPRRDRH